MIIAGTGSRSLALASEEFKDFILAETMKELSLKSPDFVMSGMAEGFDACLALAAIRLDIPFIAAVPTPNYGDYYWGQHSQHKTNRKHIFDWFLSKAHEVHYTSPGPLYIGGRHVNFVRNSQMVRAANRFVVYADSLSANGNHTVNSRGTRHCLLLIHKARLPYTLIPTGVLP